MSRPLPLLLAAAAGGAVVLAFQRLLGSLRRAQHTAAANGHDDGTADGKAKAPSLRGAPPHPDWRPPQKQPLPFSSSEMHTVDPSQTSSDVLYPLMISAVVPRPIGECSKGSPCSRAAAGLPAKAGEQSSAVQMSPCCVAGCWLPCAAKLQASGSSAQGSCLGYLGSLP